MKPHPQTRHASEKPHPLARLTPEERHMLDMYRELLPASKHAMIVLTEHHLAECAKRKEGRRSILGRLQQAHTCPDMGLGFEQQAPDYTGQKSWLCNGCGQLVTLVQGDR
jgi:hypothetical protein